MIELVSFLLTQAVNGGLECLDSFCAHYMVFKQVPFDYGVHNQICFVLAVVVFKHLLLFLT